MAKDERTRNWAFILYPDSAPPDWRDRLDSLHIQWIESPLHDADQNADESQKKPHWHILLLFDGNKSFDQVCSITTMLNAPIPQKCANAKGMVRYMIHLDNPEKHQYSREEIIGHGGADVAEYLRPTSGSRYEMLREMTQFIRDKNIVEYSDFIDYVIEERYDDWFPLLADNSTIYISTYITSRRNKLCKRKTVKMDIDTGEIVN